MSARTAADACTQLMLHSPALLLQILLLCVVSFFIFNTVQMLIYYFPVNHRQYTFRSRQLLGRYGKYVL